VVCIYKEFLWKKP